VPQGGCWLFECHCWALVVAAEAVRGSIPVSRLNCAKQYAVVGGVLNDHAFHAQAIEESSVEVGLGAVQVGGHGAVAWELLHEFGDFGHDGVGPEIVALRGQVE
jgi:hypothetical protein